MSVTVIKIVKILFAVILPNIGGLIGSRVVRTNLDWFATLKQPKFNPPSYLFAPVWTFIYCCIGYASYLVFEELRTSNNGFDRTALIVLALFAIQMISNWIWTPIFFGHHSLKWSTVDIIVTLVSATACGYAFWRINRVAGLLFIPYIIWLCYATYLNVGVYILNENQIEATTNQLY